MKIPLSLIKSYLPFDLTIEQLSETLTLLGIEVDAVIHEHPPFAKVIVGEVLSVEPHPNAKKLQIAQVHNGVETVQVVCGASNCRAGIKTAFAVVGSFLMDSKGMPQSIDKATLRDIDSFGMLCSASELGLWKEDEGIMELPLEYPNGKDLASLLWDPILELSLTPNLGHCFSALGIARELGASLQKSVQRKENTASIIEEKKIKILIEDPEQVPRYMGRLIENVKIGPSPFWLQKELHFLGMKPINNIVDVTNYILMKTGQPMHAFDFDQIAGKTLKIGPAQSGEKWLGLDGIWREISKGTLIISDANKPVAVAGVLGGDNSAVTESTVNIFLEAAFFDPVAIRKGAKELGVRTDSAIRFEKGVDPNGVEIALDEATQLIQEIAGGNVSAGKVDLKKSPFERKKILFRPEKANALLGTKFSISEVKSLLRRLDCIISTEELPLVVEPPTYRFDLNEEIDLVEEIVRLYGYNKVKRNLVRSISSQIPNDPGYLFEKKLRHKCISLGLQEFLTSDLISPKLAEICQEICSLKEIQLLKAVHAKTEEYSVLRPSLLPGLLQVAKSNLDLKNSSFSAFEIGRIHFLQKGKPIEVPILSFLMGGKEAPLSWDQKPREVDFYSLKGVLESLLNALQIENISFRKSNHISFHPGRQADLVLNDLVIGSIGEVHPKTLSQLDIKERILFAELDVEHLMRLSKPISTFSTIPSLPASQRDWTVTLPSNLSMEQVFTSIQKHKPRTLETYALIDLYKNENATFRFTYRDPVKTISSDEVEKDHLLLISQVSSEISC